MKIPVKIGDVIQGAYRVERVIGMGGMAVVVAAIDLNTQQRVAVKILLKKAARSDEVVKRFQREQRTISMLRSEHVTRMLGAGVHGSLPFMVMEYLEGEDLSDVLKKKGPLQVAEAVDYALQAMEAIAEAHSIGVIHRDLKPGNLFLTRGPDGLPFVKVLDFGISKAAKPQGGDAESSLTQTSAIMGTPFYMSPEQLLSARNVTVASDIWALGVIVHQLITNSLPFAAASPEKVCSRVLNGSPTLIRDVNPNLPEGLEETIHRCLQRKPQNRFANVADLALKLVAYGPERSRRSVAFITEYVEPSELVTEKITIRGPGVPSEPDTATVIYVARDSKASAKRSILTGVFGLAMFGCGLGVGLWFSGAPKAAAAVVAAPGTSASSGDTPSLASAKPPDEAPDLPEPDLGQASIEMDLDQVDPSNSRQKREKRAPKEGAAALPSSEAVAAPSDTSRPTPSVSAAVEARSAPAAEKAEPTVDEAPKERSKKTKSKPAGDPSVPVNPYDSE